MRYIADAYTIFFASCLIRLSRLSLNKNILCSIWEEEGCNMVSMSCNEHDGFTANSQFITHLTGRILGAQGLKATPVRYFSAFHLFLTHCLFHILCHNFIYFRLIPKAFKTC